MDITTKDVVKIGFAMEALSDKQLVDIGHKAITHLKDEIVFNQFFTDDDNERVMAYHCKSVVEQALEEWEYSGDSVVELWETYKIDLGKLKEEIQGL